MPKDSPDAQALIAAWRTSHRVTSYLIENLPAELCGLFEEIPESEFRVDLSSTQLRQA